MTGHPFGHPGPHPDHPARSAAYWAEALGGPAGYPGAMADHSHVLRLHSGNGEHHELDGRAIACFDAASKTWTCPTTSGSGDSECLLPLGHRADGQPPGEARHWRLPR